MSRKPQKRLTDTDAPVHHRENVDAPGTPLCAAEPGRHLGHYLIAGDLQKEPERIAHIDCPACLRLLFLDAHQGRDWMTKTAVAEGEAKHRAQVEAEHAAAMLEAAQTHRLGLAIELRACRAALQAAMEDVNALTSGARARGQVRAQHDEVYRIYRDEVIRQGVLTAEVRQRLLDQTAPGDAKRMKAILCEDEAAATCSAFSRRNSREAHARQVVVPEARMTRVVKP